MHIRRYDTRPYSILTIAKPFHLQMYETVEREQPDPGDLLGCALDSIAFRVKIQ